MDELVDQLPCGVFLIDQAGCIIGMNATAERHLTHEPGEFIGQPLGQILTLASRMFLQTHVYPLINLHGRADELSLTLLTRTGEPLPVLLNAVRRLDGNREQIYCAYLPLGQRHHYEAELIQARTTAEEARLTVEQSEARYRALAAGLEVQVAERTQALTQANEELRHSIADLHRSNENLQQFAYVASHDLQEPLRKIQSFGDILRRQYADQLGDAVDYLERMQVAAGRMSMLIKDLLTYSRISTQQNATAVVSLTNVVNTVLNDLELAVQETNARVDVQPLPTVRGDASQLGQLFLNLLSNALKFHRPGESPVIRVSTESVEAAQLPDSVKPARLAPAYYRIDVSDNGIGFDEKYVDRIFQVFQRLHGRNQYAGTGIGLAICEKVAANHGGAITATSRPGQGATFSIYLPQ